jgi:hypothetical protein
LTAAVLSLQELAATALAVLARDASAGAGAWRAAGSACGIDLRIVASGPELPTSVPEAIALPELVRRAAQWRGAYRLNVRAPVNVLELEWNPGEPLRIFAFSRGEWETALAELARRGPG